MPQQCIGKFSVENEIQLKIVMISINGDGMNAMVIVMMSKIIKMAGKVTCPVSVKGEKMTQGEREQGGREEGGRGISAYHRSP